MLCGRHCGSCQRILGLIAAAPEGKITFTADLERFAITVTYACGRASFPGMSAEQFPPIPEPGSTQQAIPLPVVALRKTIEGVSVSVADPTSAPTLAMTCILAQVSQEFVTFAAVDGKRVSYDELLIPSGDPTPFGNILIPQQGLSELASILPKEGAVLMSLTPNKSQVIFSTPSFSLTATLMNGEFPNYRSVIPKHRPTKMTVKTVEFTRIAKLTQLFAEGNLAALVTIKSSRGLEPGTLTCASQQTESGGNDNTIGALVEGIEGDELKIAFNVKFLLDALQTVTTPEVRLEIGFAEEAKTPAPVGFLTSVGAPGSVHCFMPMKI